MAPGASPARNNAFGIGSPSWNLKFPDGNLTAVEILTYLPHWLKSVDVVTRFVSNRARAVTVASILTDAREQPSGGSFITNSIQIMMSNAMRGAGYKNWTFSTHGDWEHEIEVNSIDVKDFRPPCLTRIVKSENYTEEALRSFEEAPINFTNLALYVAEHPSGPDALDLTRCVEYALDNPDEIWLFPDDFARLVSYLGGPQTVTVSHLDKAAFARREGISPKKSTPRSAFRYSSKQPKMRLPYIPEDSPTPKSISRKRSIEELGIVDSSSKRRSGRLVGKRVNLREESSDLTDKNTSAPDSRSNTPSKKRRLSNVSFAGSNDSDFQQNRSGSELDDDIVEGKYVLVEDDVVSSPPPRKRKAARRARVNIQFALSTKRAAPDEMHTPNKWLSDRMSKLAPIPEYMTTDVPSELRKTVREFENRQPTFLEPPILSTDRLRVDASSIFLYAAEDCKTVEEMWATALAYDRYGGPRRSAPYRELHRLSDPDPSDTTGWAENIRWAKEQYRRFGSVTWTEYDYHLDLIKEARYENMWVSEEVVMAGL